MAAILRNETKYLQLTFSRTGSPVFQTFINLWRGMAINLGTLEPMNISL